MPFTPLDDDLPPSIRIDHPWSAWGLMAACLWVYWAMVLVGYSGGERIITSFGVIPSALSGAEVATLGHYNVAPVITLITYQFIHAGPLHLFGNLLYFWVFADNVEDAMGHGRFLLFYLLCGVLAAGAHWLAQPYSGVPLVGASGAISGVLGAYLVLHPKAKILVPIYFIPVHVPAWMLLVFWFGFQLVSLVTYGDSESGPAWWAHIGGFIAGALLIVPFRYPTVPLFGGSDLPGGITLRDRARWQRRQAHRRPKDKDRHPEE